MSAPFIFRRLTPTIPELKNVVSANIGHVGELPTTNDINKAVMMNNDGFSYILCGDGDELEGFIDSISPERVNSTWDANGQAVPRAFGGVRRNPIHREEVTVAAGSPKLAILDYVVAAAQLPLGVKGLAQVKKGEPKRHPWRVISLLGSQGNPGETVLIERNN